MNSTLTEWPDVSVIIPVFNDKRRLRKCLSALRQQDYPKPPEIIVVDNNSTETYHDIKSDFPGVFILNEPRVGSYHSRNTGISAAHGTVIAFTDADCEPESGWLRAGVTAMKQAKYPCVVGGRIDMIAPENRTRSAAENYGLVASFPQAIAIRWRDYSVSANLFAQRETLQAVGPFLARLRSGGDSEWCRRAIREGYRLVYADNAVVRHPARVSHKEHVAVIRRVEAGVRDLYPHWTQCLVEVVKCMMPPIIETAMMLGRRARDLSGREKILYLAYAWRLRWLRAWVRLKYQFDSAESPRS